MRDRPQAFRAVRLFVRVGMEGESSVQFRAPLQAEIRHADADKEMAKYV